MAKKRYLDVIGNSDEYIITYEWENGKDWTLAKGISTAIAMYKAISDVYGKNVRLSKVVFDIDTKI